MNKKILVAGAIGLAAVGIAGIALSTGNLAGAGLLSSIPVQAQSGGCCSCCCELMISSIPALLVGLVLAKRYL